MKICPVCETKIEGRFCKNCFHFVTPWNVSDDTYINKSHDSRKDKSCEYHNPKTRYSSQEYMTPGYEKRIYGGAGKETVQGRKQTRQPAGQNRKKTSGGKTSDSGKQLRIGMVICIFMLVIGVAAALVEIGYINLSDFSRTPEPEHGPEREPASSNTVTNEPATVYDDSRSIKGYLQTISYVTKEESYLGTYYYYDPENIQGLTEYHCDNGHFDMTVDEFHDLFILFYGEEPLETDIDSEPENNYLLKASAGKDRIVLETGYEWTYETFDVEVLADTASGEVHGYSFTASGADDEFYDMVYRWCEEEIPGRFSSVEDMKNDFSSNGGYLSEITGDDVRFKVFQMGTYVSVEFGK